MESFVFRKQILIDLKKSCGINEPKECMSSWQTLKAAGVMQACHNSLISAFLISQLDLLPTTSHISCFKLGVGVVRPFLLIVRPYLGPQGH